MSIMKLTFEEIATASFSGVPLAEGMPPGTICSIYHGKRSKKWEQQLALKPAPRARRTINLLDMHSAARSIILGLEQWHGEDFIEKLEELENELKKYLDIYWAKMLEDTLRSILGDDEFESLSPK